MNNTSVDSYLQDGCGRCPRYQTPACKVHTWAEGLVALRGLLQATELVEEMKWGMPTYTLQGKNVLILAAFNDYVALNFFRGSLLADPDGILDAAGPNSRVARVLKLRAASEIDALRPAIERMVQRAIQAQRDGVKVPRDDKALELPDALQDRLDGDDALAGAFAALTPGRQRSHAIYVGGAKQEATQRERVERCVPKILAGKGFLDR